MIRFDLTGRTVVVTGASKNIGAALARGFADAGADLLLVARGAELLETVAGSIRREAGVRVGTCVADVGTAEGARHVIDAAQRLDRVDVLVNNAASARSAVGPVLAMEDDIWDDVMSVNVLAPFRLARGLLPRLAARPGSSILNVVSGSGFLPSPGVGAYGVSKAATWMLTRQLAVELAPAVRVNALCPGIVSPDGRPHHPAHEALLPLVPLGRLGRPEEMVGAALYLTSDAASYTTGEVIFANGGRPW